MNFVIPDFEYPGLLYLLLVLVPLIAWYVIFGRKKKASLQVSSKLPFLASGKSVRQYLQHIPFVLRCLAIAFIIIAIARPRSHTEFERIDSEGIDIMFTMDVSTSMSAYDFKPNRLEAAKTIAAEFIAQRPSDRMGIVVFAGESFVQCPLTTDRPTLINLMNAIQMGVIEDGTAIGNGLGTAVGRLKDSEAKSRVVILLTDGDNNRGEITPEMAAEIAQMYGVRVYTIGVGARGEAMAPVQTPFGIEVRRVKVEINETLLRKIAEMTGGKYFRATDNTKLIEIYNEIDQMEKSRTMVDSFPIYKEEFMPFALAALLALLLELFLRLFIVRRIP